MNSPNEPTNLMVGKRTKFLDICLKMIIMVLGSLLIAMFSRENIKAQGMPTADVTLNASVYLEPLELTGIGPTEIQDFFSDTNTFIDSRNSNTSIYGSIPLKLNLNIRDGNNINTTLLTGQTLNEPYCDKVNADAYQYGIFVSEVLDTQNVPLSLQMYEGGPWNDFILCIHDQRYQTGNFFLDNSNRVYLYADDDSSNPALFTNLYSLYDNNSGTGGDNVYQTFVHEMAHVLSLPDAYTAESIQWDGLATNILNPTAYPGVTIPRYKDYFQNMNYSDIISTKVLLSNDAWFNPADLKYLNYRLKQVEDLGRGSNDGMSYSQYSTTNDWTYDLVLKRVLSNGIKFQLPTSINGTNVSWESCRFVEGQALGQLGGTGNYAPRTVINTLADEKIFASNEYIYHVPGSAFDHTFSSLSESHVSAIHCESPNLQNPVYFWLAGHSYKEAFVEYFTNPDYNAINRYENTVTATVECTNPHDWCRFNGELEYGEQEVNLYGIDLMSKDKESWNNLYRVINQEEDAVNVLFSINENGTYTLLSDSYSSKTDLIQKTVDYVGGSSTSSGSLNYNSIANLINAVVDTNGKTLSFGNPSKNIYILTDKPTVTGSELGLIQEATSDGYKISTLYLGSGTVPASYSNIASGTAGKVVDKGIQQDASERLDDLLRYNKQNHYTDFSYEVTSGFEGEVPLTVTFDSNSYNGYTPTTYAWDLDGDGDVDSTQANPSYTYTVKGTYDVKLYTSNGVFSDTKVNYELIDTISGAFDPVTQWGKNQTSGNTQAQAFDKEGNMYMIGDLWEDMDLGNGVVLQEFSDAGDAVLVKYDSNGKALWGKLFGGTMHAELSQLKLDKDGNAYVIGNFRGWSTSPSTSLYIDGVSYPRIVTPASQAVFDETFFVAKITASGSLAWVHQLQTDRDVWVNELMIDDAGNVAMAGTFENTLKVSNGAQLTVAQVAGYPNYWPKAIFVVKLNTLGQYQWGRVSYGAFNTGGTKSAVMDSSGDVLVYGTHRSTDTNIYDYPVFVRVNGVTGVATVTNLPDTEVRMDQMEIDGEDNLYFRGEIHDAADTLMGEDMSLTGDYQDYIAKFDSDHNLLWSYQKGLEYGNFTLMNVKDNGEVYFAGSLYNRNNEDEVASFQTVSGTKNFVGVGDWSALLGGLTKNGDLKWIESYFPMNEGWSTQYQRNTHYSDIYSIAFGPRNTVGIGGEYYTTMRNPDGAQFNMTSTYGGGFMYKMGVGNLFGSDVEGWTSTNTSVPVTHGSAKITNSAGGEEVYLKAPVQYRGDQSDKYGGKLSFDLQQSIDTNQLATYRDVVIKGYGIEMHYDIPTPSTSGTHYELLLNEGAGWKDNTGSPIYGETFRNILGNIIEIKILANYSSDANEVSLTNITFGERLNPVVANFTPSVTTGVAPLSVNFTNTSVNETAWGWDFNNDGLIDSELENPSYTFNTVGTYVVRLIASGAGDTSSKEVTIVAGTTSVTAGFSGTPVSGYAPLNVAFTDSSTASNTTITSRSWDFNNDGVVDSTAQNPSFTYTTAGTYTVKLTVSNGTISDDEVKTAYITVNNAALSCTQVEYTTIDTFARAGTYANNNYGTETTMYTKDGGTNYDRQSFMRFDLTATDYTTITSAKLRLFVDDIAMSFTAQPNVRFYDVTSNTWTETGLTWNNKPSLGSTITTWNAVDSQEKTWLEIDMTSYIQAELNGDRIINIGTWDVNASDEEVEFDTRDSINKPFLEITGVSGDCLPPMAEGTYELDRQVSTAHDDGGEDLEYAGSGDMMRTRVDLFLTRAWGTDDFETAVRFQNITIPQGATIKSAYIEVVSHKLHGSVVNMNIYGHDVDNAPKLEYITNDITSRAKTTAYYNWTNLGVWNQNSAYRTGDLKNVIQEIVDRGGWVSGNSMMFIINGTGDRSIYSYDGSTTYAPKLHIEYDL